MRQCKQEVKILMPDRCTIKICFFVQLGAPLTLAKQEHHYNSWERISYYKFLQEISNSRNDSWCIWTVYCQSN